MDARDPIPLGAVPGMAYALIADGGIREVTGVGVADPDGAAPVGPDTAFRIASVTKPVTATVIWRLAERGVVDLDAPAFESASLRMLLTHTAGLPASNIADGPPPAGVALGPALQPSYSNLGYALAGRYVEAVTGRDFADLMDELVVRPLGMTRTSFNKVPESDSARANGDDIFDHAWGPAGLLWSTASDLARFAIAHLTDQSLRPMHALHARHHVDRDAGFGVGFEVYRSWNGREMVVHSGSLGDWWAVLAMVPSRGAAVVMLCNSTPGWGLPYTPYRMLDELLGLPAPDWGRAQRGGDWNVWRPGR